MCSSDLLGDDVNQGLAFVLGVGAGGFGKCHQCVPTAVELHLDLTQGVLAILVERDERALCTEDVQGDDDDDKHNQPQKDN